MKVLDVNWRLIRFSPAIFIISLLLQIFRLGLLLAPGLVLRTVFDRLATAAPLDWHLWGVIALIVVLAIARIAALLSGVAVESTGYFIVTALLRTNLFECLLRRADARALPAPVGDLVNRLDKDAGNLGTLINLEVLTLGGSVGALVAIGLMLSIDPVIASVVLVPLVLAGFASSLLGSRLMVYQRRNRAADGTVSAFLGEAFSAVQALQVATAEARTVERLRRLNNARRDAAVKQRLFAFMLFDRFVTGIAQFGIGVVVLLAGRAIRAGTFTIGDFALVTYLLPQVADFAFYVGGVLVFLKQARVSLDQVVPLLQGAAPTALVQARPVPWHHVAASEEREVVPQQQLERLTVHGLSYRYPDGGHGITDVHLDLRRGSFTVITGRIGSGKTTVLRALLGLLPKDRGDFHWNGTVVNDPAAFFVPPRSATRRRCPTCSAKPYRKTSCWDARKVKPNCTTPYAWRCWNRMWRRSAMVSIPWLAAVASNCPVVKCSVPPQRGCSCARQTSWSSTTCQAPSMWKRNASCGTTSLRRGRRPIWLCPIGERRCSARITSSCSTTAGLWPRARCHGS